jgi:hypothetical protein
VVVESQRLSSAWLIPAMPLPIVFHAFTVGGGFSPDKKGKSRHITEPKALIYWTLISLFCQSLEMIIWHLSIFYLEGLTKCLQRSVANVRQKSINGQEYVLFAITITLPSIVMFAVAK